MVNNSERSKQWRNKRKNDPNFLENERKRKQESRKKRTDEQRQRDRELCKARQKKYRQKRRELVTGSGDVTEGQVSDSSDVYESAVLDTDSISSVTQSHDLGSVHSVPEAVNNSSNKLNELSSECFEHVQRSEDDEVKDSHTSCSVMVSENDLESVYSVAEAIHNGSVHGNEQSPEFFEHVNRSENDEVVFDANIPDTSCTALVSERELQIKENGAYEHIFISLNDAVLATRSLGNNLQNSNYHSQYPTSDLEVVQSQSLCDVNKTADSNCSILPFNILSVSNSVLQGEEDIRPPEGIVYDSDSSNDATKCASKNSTGIARKSEPKQLIELTSESATYVSNNVKGISEQDKEPVFESSMNITANLECNMEQPKHLDVHDFASKICTDIVPNTDDKSNPVLVSEPINITSTDENISKPMNDPTSEPLFISRTNLYESVLIQRDEFSKENLDERAKPQTKVGANSSPMGKKTTKWIQQYAEGENHEVISFLTNDDTCSVTSQRQAFFLRMQRELSQITDFIELKSRCGELFCEIEKRYPLPAIPTLRMSRHQRDMTALSLYPQDAPCDHIPIRVVGDGNCLPRVGSLFAFGNDNRHEEIRVRIFLELCMFEDTYLNDSYLNRGLESDRQARRTVTLIAQYSDVYTRDIRGPDRDRYIYRENAKNVLNPGSYNGMWSVFALASVIGVKIRSIYPDYGGHNVREDHNRLVIPRVSRNNDGVINIMWTSTLGRQPLAAIWTPNHFVAVLHKSQIDESLGANGDTTEGNTTELSVGCTSLGDTERTIPPQTTARSMFMATNNNVATSIKTENSKLFPQIGGQIARNTDSCSLHLSKKLVYLCTTCENRAICNMCLLEGHKNHEYEDLELHLKKRENEYIQRVLGIRISELRTEMQRQRDNHNDNIARVARKIDERVASVSEELERWRHQCRQKLQEDGQEIHNNIRLFGTRVIATIPNYIRNVKHQLRQLDISERLARMSETPPPDDADSIHPCPSIQFIPGNTKHLIQQFGSLSCSLSEPVGTSAVDTKTNGVTDGDNAFPNICRLLSVNPVPRNLQSRVLVPLVHINTRRSGTEDMSHNISTSGDLPSCSSSNGSSNAHKEERIKTNSNKNEPNQHKRLRHVSVGEVTRDVKQKLKRQLDAFPDDSVINKRPCSAPTMSEKNDKERKQTTESANVVQQLERPNMEVPTSVTHHHINVCQNETAVRSLALDLSVRTMPIKLAPFSEKQTLGAIVTTVQKASQSQIKNTVIATTCLARAKPSVEVDMGSPCDPVIKTQRMRSICISGPTAATSEDFAAGSKQAVSRSLNCREKADQINGRQSRVQTDMECNNLPGINMVTPRDNTVNDLSPRTSIAVNKQPINSTVLAETTSTVSVNVDERKTNILRITPMSDEKQGMARTTNTSDVTSTLFNRKIKAGTANTSSTWSINTMKKNSRTIPNSTGLKITKVARPKMMVNGTTKNTSEQEITQTTKTNEGWVIKGANIAEMPQMISKPSTEESIGNSSKINHKVGTTPSVNSNAPEIIKTVSVTRPRLMANTNVNSTTNVPSEVRTAQKMANENITGQFHAVDEVTNIPMSETTGSIKNTERTMPKPSNRFLEENEILNDRNSLIVSNKHISVSTSFANAVEATKNVNKKANGNLQTVNAVRSTPLNVAGVHKLRNVEGAIRNPFVTFTGSIEASEISEPTSLATTDAETETKRATSATQVIHKPATEIIKKVKLARTPPFSNINSNGTTKIRCVLEMTPKVNNNNNTRTAKPENKAQSTTLSNRNGGSRKIQTLRGMTPISYIDFSGATKTTMVRERTSIPNKKPDSSIKTTNSEGTKLRVNIIETTEMGNTAKPSSTADINTAKPSSTADINTVKPSSTANINTAKPSSLADINTAKPSSTADINTAKPSSTADINVSQTTALEAAKSTHKLATAKNHLKRATSADGATVLTKRRMRSHSVEGKELCGMASPDNTTESSHRDGH